MNREFKKYRKRGVGLLYTSFCLLFLVNCTTPRNVHEDNLYRQNKTMLEHDYKSKKSMQKARRRAVPRKHRQKRSRISRKIV